MADYTEYHGEAIKRFVKSPTQADGIRAMSNEELANFLAWVCYKAYSNWNPHYVQDPKEWVEWLNSPVAGGDGDDN